MASIKVAVRVRPLNKREEDLSCSVIISMKNKKTSITNTKLPQTPEKAAGDCSSLGRERIKQFTYDHSYWSLDSSDDHYASQQQVFLDLGHDVVQSAYSGYNACIFAYGQTGSGKTYTMMGTEEDAGLIPRICQHLFMEMKDPDIQYKTQVSYLEIYNERVRDLLRDKSQPQQNLKVREHPKEGPYVQDLSKHIVVSYTDIQLLIEQGNSNRTTAATNMNDLSSRSHAIFTILFTQAQFKDDIPSEIHSKINLVDLAGSERADASGATGDRLKEGGSINKSLVTLGNVISTLADISEGMLGSPRRNVFIPYRDSVLTWLLRDSLGGNSKTIMVAAISPAECNYAETLSTLRYANRAKKIVNKPTVNEDPNVKLIRELREENARLKDLLGTQQNWFLNKKKLSKNQERMKALTEKWTDKWQETACVLEEHRMLALRKEGQSIVLDSDLPYLLALDDNILSTGMKLYHLKEGDTTVGNGYDDLNPDIVLEGPYISEQHCLFRHKETEVCLIPCENSRCSVNNNTVHQSTKLNQGAVIRLGKYHLFRFNHPGEAAKLREQLKEKQTDELVKVFKNFQWSWSKSTSSLTDSAVGSDLELDEVCTCSEHRLEEQRKELEQLKEEQLRCEAKRLAQLAEQEANKKHIAEEKVKLDQLAKDAQSMKEQAQKTKDEIVKIGQNLEKQAAVQLKEHKQLKLHKDEVEQEKQKAREERQKLRQQKQQQKDDLQELERKHKVEEEELKNEKKSLIIQKQQNEYILQEHKKEVEKERDIEKDIFQSEVESMRKLVHREVAHIRSMAGLDILTTKDQKEADNESEVLDGLENDRLMLKDISSPLAPVLPDIYFQPTVKADEQHEHQTDEELPQKEKPNNDVWENLDRKFEKLELQEKPIGHWKPEEVSTKLEELGTKVKEIHNKVCKCLQNKYSSVLSSDDKTQGLSKEVIDQFTHIRPLFEQLEKVIADKGGDQVQTEKLKDYDHSLATIDTLLQIHEVIQTVEKAIKSKEYLVAIESLDALYNLMANLDVENATEIGVKKCLQVELCLLREKLMYSLNETWGDLLKWTLPNESRRLANRPRTVMFKVTGVNEKESVLLCTIQAMHSVNILESRLKVLCDRIMMYFIEPIVQDKNTVFQILEEHEPCACSVIHPANSQVAITPQEVFQKLEKVFLFLHNPLHKVIIHDNNHVKEGERDTSDLVQKLGHLMCKRLFECVYKDCLSHCVPKTPRQFDNFNKIVTATEAFQDLLLRLKFMGSEEATLMDYLNNVNKLFANVKGQEMLKQAHELLSQDLGKYSHVSNDHPLGMKSGEDKKKDDKEEFVQQCKQTANTVNLNLPNCQISSAIRSLMGLAYSTIKDTLGTGGGQDAANHLSNSVHSMFELYCDVVPSYHRDRLKTVPLLAALHHNNCMFVAHHLITIDKWLNKKGARNTAASRETRLQDLIPQIRKMGNEHFTEHLNIKKEELCDKLIEAQGFECVADDEGEGAQLAIKHMLHYLKSIAEVWKEVLPVNVYCRATGSLLNSAIEEITEAVLEIEEFSVDDCEFLKESLTIIPQAAVEFFKMDVGSSNPQVVLHENVPSWLRFTEIIIMLASGLQDISDRWADGKGPLAMYLSSDEVRGFVLAMFENTSKREKVLREVTKPSVSSLLVPAFPMKRMKSSPL